MDENTLAIVASSLTAAYLSLNSSEIIAARKLAYGGRIQGSGQILADEKYVVSIFENFRRALSTP